VERKPGIPNYSKKNDSAWAEIRARAVAPGDETKTLLAPCRVDSLANDFRRGRASADELVKGAKVPGGG
jgi:hypothetical protein